jgi:hypothetical protein
VAIGVSTTAGSVLGTIYVADPLNNQVLVFAPGGGPPASLSTLACPPSLAACGGFTTYVLNQPTFVAVGLDGNLWISDTGNDVVVETTPAGTVLAFAGVGPLFIVCGCSIFGCGGCPPPHFSAGQADGQFFGPGALAIDSQTGELYVADAAGAIDLGEAGYQAANIRVEKFSKTGSFEQVLGSWCTLKPDGTQAAGNCNTSAPGAVALGDGQFAHVTGMAVDGSSNLYVAEDAPANNRVQKFNPSGTFLLKWGGQPTGSGPGMFNGPGGIAVDLDQTVYVTDVLNDRIQVFDGNGHFISTSGSTGAGEVQFNHPFAIASVPPAASLLCLFGFNPTLSDCIHGLIVSEISASGNNRVQVLAGRYDHDNDGITDEIDTAPNSPSNGFSNGSLGFTTSGTVVSPGNQTFTIYATLGPTPIDEVHVLTETTGGASPLVLSLCAGPTVTFVAGTDARLHCSVPTVTADVGPVDVRFVGQDGTVATATLRTGDSLSMNPATSQITDNVGVIALTVGGEPVSLNPGQSVQVQSPALSVTSITSASPTVAVVGQGVVVSFSVSAPPGYNVSPTGTVTVSASTGETCNASAPTGSCTLTFASPGSRLLTADYSGDSRFLASRSPTVTQTVSDFKLSAAPSVRTVAPGGHATYTVTAAPVSGFTGSVSLACNGAPASSTCTITPSTLTLGASASARVVVRLPHRIHSHTYTVTFTGVTGTGNPATGGLAHSTDVELRVKHDRDEHESGGDRDGSGDDEHR